MVDSDKSTPNQNPEFISFFGIGKRIGFGLALKEKDVVRWKIEAIPLIFIVISIFFSFYLTFLSLQTVDEALSRQLVAFAASFLIAGITILAVLIVHLGIKKAFLRIEEYAKGKIKASTHEEG